MMILAVGSLVSSLASSVLGSSLVFALATAAQATAGEPAAPSAIEQALIERACTGAPSGVVADRQREEERQREEAAERRQAEEFRRRQASQAGVDQPASDPYRVLGLAAGATNGQIRAAYEEARQKYDPEQVAHLGDDVQMHFAEKSRAAERAYRMLAGDAAAPRVEANAASFSRPADYSAARFPAM